jgi:hypothetical protein
LGKKRFKMGNHIYPAAITFLERAEFWSATHVKQIT